KQVVIIVRVRHFAVAEKLLDAGALFRGFGALHQIAHVLAVHREDVVISIGIAVEELLRPLSGNVYPMAAGYGDGAMVWRVTHVPASRSGRVNDPVEAALVGQVL